MGLVAEDFILDSMEDFKFYGQDILFNSGFPVENSKNLEIARVAFGIPNGESVYFAITADTFGKFKKESRGFAIASHGIYLNADGKRKVRLSFEKFNDMEISKFLSYVKIGGYEFNVGFPGKIAKFLEYVQLDIDNLLNG